MKTGAEVGFNNEDKMGAEKEKNSFQGFEGIELHIHK